MRHVPWREVWTVAFIVALGIFLTWVAVTTDGLVYSVL